MPNYAGRRDPIAEVAKEEGYGHLDNRASVLFGSGTAPGASGDRYLVQMLLDPVRINIINGGGRAQEV